MNNCSVLPLWLGHDVIMYDQHLEILNIINISKLENRQTKLIEFTLYQILEILNLPE